MLTTTAIPAFNDNYIWLIKQQGSAWVVDPGDATPVIQQLNTDNTELAGILITHHHRDHTGGIEALKTQWPNAHIIAPHSTKIPFATQRVKEGDTINVLNTTLTVFEVPGHTLDHIAFYSEDIGLFCGDTLFSGGCGRVFEGTYEQMYASIQKLNQLPANTAIYCTHEYTLANLNFASEIEPDNRTLAKHLDYIRMLRSDGTITLPSRFMLEREINPFLRCHQPAVIQAAKQINSAESDVLVFAAIRALKDNF